MKALSRTLLWLAALGLLVPPLGTASAAGPQTLPAANSSQVAIQDVALTADGQLRGQVVDRTGTAKVNSPVSLLSEDREVAKATTDQQGQFAIPLAKGGVYQLRTTEGAALLRVWTNQTAPPSAREGVLLVSDREIVRGNLGERGMLLPLIVVAGVAAVLVAAATTRHDAS